MKKGRGKLKKRVFAAVLSLAMVLTGITWPEILDKDIPVKVEAAGGMVKVRSLADPDASTVVRSFNVTMLDIVRKYNNMGWRTGYNWSGNEDDIVITQARKYQYDRATNTRAPWPDLYPTNTTVDISEFEDTGANNFVALDNDLVKVGGTRDPNPYLTGDERAIADDGKLYHYYDLDLPRGTQVPVNKWVVSKWGAIDALQEDGAMIAACHYEPFSSTEGEGFVSPSNGLTTYPVTKPYIAGHEDKTGAEYEASNTGTGSEYGFLTYNGQRYGLWAYFRGVEYHAARTRNDSDFLTYMYHFNYPDGESSGEIVSPCCFQNTYDPTHFPSITPDYSNWIGFCSFCGQPLNGEWEYKPGAGDYNYNPTTHEYTYARKAGDWVLKSHFFLYANKDAMRYLPTYEIGRMIFLQCGQCGGMENTYEMRHVCTGISPNKFQVKYHLMGGYGQASPALWLTDYETEYEGMAIAGANQVKNVNSGANCFKEGYTFKGWAFSVDNANAGIVEVVPGLSLKTLQNDNHGVHDQVRHQTTFTLYAVWGPQENAVVIDAQSSNTLNGTASFKKTVASGTLPTGVTYSGSNGNPIATYNSVSKTVGTTVNYVINTSNTNYPIGWQIKFDTTAKDGSGTGSNLQYSNIRGKVYASNIKYYGQGDGGFLGQITNKVANDDGSFSFTYKYGVAKPDGSSGYVSTPDKVDIQYRQGDIILPKIDAPSGKVFLGWYTENGIYAGMPGDSYPSPTMGDETLYPKFSSFKLETTEVYYETSHSFNGTAKTNGVIENGDTDSSKSPSSGVVKATGAVNLKVETASSPASTDVYTLEWSSDNVNWHDISLGGDDGQASMAPGTIVKTVSVSDSMSANYTIEQTGYYTITALGGNGTNYNNVNIGGKGGKTEATYYFVKGDVIRILCVGNVGGGGDKNPATTATAEDNTTILLGGTYTHVIVQHASQYAEDPGLTSGKYTTLMIAGGGGAASKKNSGGDAGGAGTNETITGNIYNGGGSTYTPPVAHEHHNHTLAGCVYDTSGWTCGYNYSCSYHIHQDPACYDEIPHVHHNHERLGCSKDSNGNYTCGYDYSCPGHYNDYCGGMRGDGTRGYCPNCGVDESAGCTNTYGSGICCHIWANDCTQTGIKVLTTDFNKCLYIGDNYPIVNYHGNEIVWICDDSPIPEQATAGIGGANYLYPGDGTYVCKPGATNGTKSATDQVTGGVTIKVNQVGFYHATDKIFYNLGQTATDTLKPGKPSSIKYEANKSNGLVTWPAVENPRTKENGTPYYYRATWYQADSASASGWKTIDTATATEYVTSAIAGYYYIANTNATYNIASNIANSANYKGPNNYTWTDKHTGDHSFIGVWSASSYMEGDQKYYNIGDVLNNVSGGSTWFHVAAVDVAGNIGDTIHVPIHPTNQSPYVGEIVFNSNPMVYQDSAKTTISYSSTTGLHKVSTTANNKNGGEYAGWYDFTNSEATGTNGTYVKSDGSKQTGRTYGTTWPTMKNDLVSGSFIGWNSQSDGKGTWYSQNGTGNGSTPDTPKKLNLSDVLPGYEANKNDLSNLKAPSYTLYAIYKEETQIKQAVTYRKAALDPKTGLVKSNGSFNMNGTIIKKAGTSGTTLETDWTNKAVFRLLGNGLATKAGRYEEILRSAYQNGTYNPYLVGTVEVYPGYFENKVPATAVQTDVTNQLSVFSSDITLEKKEDKVIGVIGETGERNIPLDANIRYQGTNLIGSTVFAKQYLDTMTRYSQGWGKETKNGTISPQESAIVRLDLTPPNIQSHTVVHHRLTDYTAEQVETWATGGTPIDLTTIFTTKVTDYHDSSYGKYTDDRDSSGIYGVYVTLTDTQNPQYTRTYPMDLASTDKKNSENSAPIEATYTTRIDTYLEFPYATELEYEIYAVDRAGNKTEDPDNLEGKNDNHKSPKGRFTNFSIKTVIKNDSNAELNLGEGMAHFFVGEYGHVDIWTVGFVEAVEMDFGAIGGEMISEILAGVEDTHNMGARSIDPNYKRKLTWDKGNVIQPKQITYFDKTVGTAGSWITLTRTDANYSKALSGELFNQTLPQSYARKYSASKTDQRWDDQGTSQKIPQNYTLGAEKYEIWNYVAIGYKGANGDNEGKTTKATSTYVICEPGEVDLHFRITHED